MMDDRDDREEKMNGQEFRQFLMAMTPEQRMLYRLETKWKHPRNHRKWSRAAVRLQAWVRGNWGRRKARVRREEKRIQDLAKACSDAATRVLMMVSAGRGDDLRSEEDAKAAARAAAAEEAARRKRRNAKIEGHTARKIQKLLGEALKKVGGADEQRAFFSKYDKDGGGTLDPWELKALIVEELGLGAGLDRRGIRAPKDKSLTDLEIGALVRSLDDDGSGTLSIEELLDFVAYGTDGAPKKHEIEVPLKLGADDASALAAAAKLCDEAVQLDAGSLEAVLVRAMVYYTQQRFSRAAAGFGAVLARDPFNARALLGRARAKARHALVLAGAQEHEVCAYGPRAGPEATLLEEATADLTVLIECEPREARHRFYRGCAHARTGRWAQAVRDFGLLKDFGPGALMKHEHALACQLKGAAHAALQEFEPAIEEFTEALNVMKRAQTFCLRGRARCCTRDWDGAVKDYNEALKLEPELAMALVGLEQTKTECKTLPLQ